MRLKNIRINIEKTLSNRFSEIYFSIRLIDVDVHVSRNFPILLKNLEEDGVWDINSLTENHIIRAYREFFWQIGTDPTKIRPSSEALIRRFLKWNTIPTINNVVDAGNVASMTTMIPIGLYDADLIDEYLQLRFASQGERFEDIMGNESILKNDQILLADKSGPIHIFLHRDSRRTMIRNTTKRVLIVGCGVQNVDRELVEMAVDEVVSLLPKLS